VPWGVLVSAGAQWPHGRKLSGMRLMGMSTRSPRPAPAVEGLVIREATPRDAPDVVHVDAAAFEEPVAIERRWIEPLLCAQSVTVAIAELHGVPVATGYTVSTDGDAGPGLYLAGVAVLPAARSRGVAAAVSTWLLSRDVEQGPRIAHLHPDSDEAARVYARLGFIEVTGFDVYGDNV